MTWGSWKQVARASEPVTLTSHVQELLSQLAHRRLHEARRLGLGQLGMTAAAHEQRIDVQDVDRGGAASSQGGGEVEHHLGGR